MLHTVRLMMPASAQSRPDWGRDRGSGITTVETADPDEMSAARPGWRMRYQQLGSGEFRGALVEARTSTVALARLCRTPGIIAQGTIPQRTVALAFSVGAAGHAFYDGVALRADDLAVARPDAEFDFRAIGASEVFVACITDVVVQRYAETTWQIPLGERSIGHRLTATPSAFASMSAPTLHSLLQTLRERPQLLTDPRVARSLENMVLNAFLGAIELPDRRVSSLRRARIARKAEEYIRAQLTEPITILDLCEVTGTSERTLHLAFLESFGISPKQLLKTLRLNAARRALRHPTAATTVTSVAMDWGFLHLGRFSIAYRAMFGETPRATLRRAATVGECDGSESRRAWRGSGDAVGARAAA